jgi:hypothetical protein
VIKGSTLRFSSDWQHAQDAILLARGAPTRKNEIAYLHLFKLTHDVDGIPTASGFVRN